MGWSIDDIKSIEDISSNIYRLAIDAGLPDGIIRRLRGDLTKFKELWRGSYHAASTLATLHNSGS